MAVFVERIRACFHKENEPVHFQLRGVDIVVSEPSDYNLGSIYFNNLEIAKGNGYSPTSLSSILNQLEEEGMHNMVLFDTPSKHFPGNHWRIIKAEPNGEDAVIRFCGIFGNTDLQGVEDVVISMNKEFFTGVSIQKYKINSIDATLDEVVDKVRVSGNYPDSLRHISDTIYFSMMSTNTLQKYH